MINKLPTKISQSTVMTLSCQRHFLNKIVLAFKSNRTHNKVFNRKKANQNVYKYSNYSRFNPLEPFCVDKLRRYKDGDPRPLRTTNI